MEKEEKYRLLTAQVKSLIDGETDFVSVMANVCSVIHEAMGFFWTGFYVVDEESHELHVGPFQGMWHVCILPTVGVCVERHGKRPGPSSFLTSKRFLGISPAAVSRVLRL